MKKPLKLRNPVDFDEGRITRWMPPRGADDTQYGWVSNTYWLDREAERMRKKRKLQYEQMQHPTTKQVALFEL